MERELKEMIEKNNWGFREMYLLYKFLNYTRDKTSKDELNYKLKNSISNFSFFAPNVSKHLLGMLNAK